MANKGARKNTMDDAATKFERRVSWRRFRHQCKQAIKLGNDMPRLSRRGW